MKSATSESLPLDVVPHDAADSALAHAAPTRDPAAVAIVKMMESPDALKNVEALERLSDLYLKLQGADAEKQFATAFNALQSEMPAIQAMKAVPNNDGSVRYTFAPFDSIMQQVKPLLMKHGFTLTFSSDVKEDRVVQTCTIQHVSGHKRSNSFAARIGSGPPKATPTQADGAASTYAKRFALCDCLNIVIEKDTDARNEGDTIPADKAMYLQEQVRETKSDENLFLMMAGVTASANPAPVSDYQKIREDKYAVLIGALEKKKKQKAAAGGT